MFTPFNGSLGCPCRQTLEEEEEEGGGGGGGAEREREREKEQAGGGDEAEGGDGGDDGGGGGGVRGKEALKELSELAGGMGFLANTCTSSQANT
uniref:Uncharacterized protein n=1 Tax=Vespula pensylvanica TaxID=30213 RepID=A0A834P988_VESPE|nr:hypothetical protein H0235_002121 [Vespula pensylvanica]